MSTVAAFVGFNVSWSVAIVSPLKCEGISLLYFSFPKPLDHRVKRTDPGADKMA